MAGRVDDARIAETELHSAEAPTCVTRADAVSYDVGAGTSASGEPGAEVAGGGEHQAVVGGVACYGGLGTGDVG